MKTLLLTLSLCLFFLPRTFAQSRQDTEKWIAETLQARALEYKSRQTFGEEGNKSVTSFLTYSDFSFGFEDGYFVIHCKAAYARYMGSDAVDHVVMRLPLWDLDIITDADTRAGEDTYHISFKTTSKAFQYVNETARYNEPRWVFNIRVLSGGNESLFAQLRDAFTRLNMDYGNPVTIK